MIFPTYQVSFEKSSFDDSVIVTGEIKNDSSRDYNLAMFKIILYSKNKRLGAGIIKVFDFKKDITKTFRAYVLIGEAKVPMIDRYETMMEGGY
jgi:hypothetical protein